ncbi:hypothetical protein N7465_002738 [Penicillium sp. CMV-2018d]|nr:hypothetical protein N7465_002738 [Penicillium sp. CMV-2018d]
MTVNTSQSTQYVVQYTNIFWQNTGPPYEPELLRAVAQSIRSLVRDFVNAVTAHRRAWHVPPPTSPI